MNELRTRGVSDILIAVVDGLTGFPDAIGTVFPQTAVQTCIVHLIRNSLAFVSWKDCKKVMPNLRAIYRAETAEAAAARLEVLAVARHALVQDRVEPVPGQSWAIVAWPGAASGIEFHWPYTLAPTPPALAGPGQRAAGMAAPQRIGQTPNANMRPGPEKLRRNHHPRGRRQRQ